MTSWLHGVADANPGLVTVEQYGTSYEGRPLWLVTVTDHATGAHDTKPAHWVDASIHAVELTATVSACHLIHHLVTGHAAGDPTIVEALRTRTFYVVPRVNPDGAEWVLADRPTFRRSSVRPWPWADGARLPGLHVEDIDGDGRILGMRIADPDGAWMPHPDDAAVADPGARRRTAAGHASVPLAPSKARSTTTTTSRSRSRVRRRRSTSTATSRPGGAPGVPGSGDHPLSEPEIDALVRAIVARPNICGYNAFHTSGGVILRPSSMVADSTLPPGDVWVWKQLAERGTALTGYTSHSMFEDFTWDPSETMSGAADDWVYEHLGVYGWTTEYWDVVHGGHRPQAVDRTSGTSARPTTRRSPCCGGATSTIRAATSTGTRSTTRSSDRSSSAAGTTLSVWDNPPPDLLRAEVAPHAEFAVYQALCSPRLEIRHTAVSRLGDDTWRVEVGLANTGWLPTDVSQRARKERLVKPIVVELTGDGVTVLDKPARREVGQLEGRAAMRFTRRQRRNARPGARGMDRRGRRGRHREYRRQT